MLSFSFFLTFWNKQKYVFFMVNYLQVKVDYLNNTTNTTKITFSIIYSTKIFFCVSTLLVSEAFSTFSHDLLCPQYVGTKQT